MTMYTLFMGYSANHASAELLYQFAEKAINNWERIGNRLQHPLNMTKSGQMSPLLRPQHGALDLVIYGELIVLPAYQEMYKHADYPNLLDQVYIYSETNSNEIKYKVGGFEILSMQHNGTNTGSLIYKDVPINFIRTLNKKYDNETVTEQIDSHGTIRFSRTTTGQYVMGIYIANI